MLRSLSANLELDQPADVQRSKTITYWIRFIITALENARPFQLHIRPGLSYNRPPRRCAQHDTLLGWVLTASVASPIGDWRKASDCGLIQGIKL